MNIGGIWIPPKSDNTLMTASKVGTSYLKLTIPLHVLPSYFKNRTAPCCDRYEYGLFTAASTLVVRVCVYSLLDNLHNFLLKMLIIESVENNVNTQGTHPILYSFICLFILGNIVTFWQELIILPTKTQQQLDKKRAHVCERTYLRMICSDMNKSTGQFAVKLSTVLRVQALKLQRSVM